MGTLYDDKNYVEVVETKLSEKAGIDALREGWLKLFGSYPTNEALAILAAQSALETGRWQKINNFNFGNLKMKKGEEFTLFATGENIWNKARGKMEWHWFEPPHFQTAFRSYNNAVDGARDYIDFLADRKSSEAWRNEAYKIAFKHLEKGEPKEYSYALYKAGYYTANPEKYTAGVIRLYEEFLKKIEGFYPAEMVMKEIIITGYVDKKDSGSGSVLEHFDEDTESKVVESQPFPISEEKPKGGGAAPILMFIAAALAAAYSWFSGLF